MKKIIISDFDDTIYQEQKIKDDVIKSIHEFRKKGNIFVIASGSSLTSIKSKMKGYNLEYDYLIINHGSTIFKKDKIIYNEPININILNEIIDKYDVLNKKMWVSKNERGNFFSTATIGLVSPEENDITKIHLEFEKKYYNDELTYLMTKYQEVLNIYPLLYNNDIEIISSKTSELNVIGRILKLENIDDKDVYTIGDGHSDVEMIKKYNGYCVNNAIKEVKLVSIKQIESVSNLIDELLG